ncbi:MAG: sugar ABC transporter permease [Streptococcaceae bacterium]|jgi:multiple sugar transport system permease protein|nr:sugar ABC transporter permease [Streptococcaceae bacterium]
MQKNNNKLGWLFTSPYVVFTLVFFLLPLLWSLWLAFTDWNMISPTINFVGVSNFVKAIQAPEVQAAFLVTYKFLIAFVPMALILSMAVALLVNALPKFKGLFMVAFFLPYLSSGVVTSLIVKGLLAKNGPFDSFLQNNLHLNVDWFGNSVTAILIISFMIAWKMAGYYGLILISGLQNINQEVYESASLDGANRWTSFWKITLPMLFPALFTVVILAVGVSFGIFTEVYQLTGGGPELATNTWQMDIFNQAFVNLNSGYASAIAIIASLVTFASIGVIRKLLNIWGKKNGWN